MPLNKHKLDNTRIFVLSIREYDHPYDIGATADFAYLDPFTQETKISSATLTSWGGRVSQQPIHTAVKFDGERVWGGNGVSRQQFDILEDLWREGRLEGTEEMTYGDLCQRLLVMAEACAAAQAGPEGP